MNKYRMSYSTFIALDGTSNQFPENSITSPLDLNTSLTITVMLRRPVNDQGLTLTQYADQIIANTAQVLTREKFLETFAVSDQDIDQVCEFAKFFGMTVIDSHTGSASVKLSATASILNRAFNVNLKQVAVDDANEYFGHAEPIGVPTELSNIIEHVLGLDSFSRPIRKSASCVVDNTDAPVVNTPNVQAAAINPNATPALQPITPIQAATAYQFPNVAGDNQCVGIVEYGGGYSKENLDKSFASVGLITPAIIDVSVNGAYNQQYSSADPDIHNYSMEVALDIFVVGCVVPNATLVMYFSDNSISHFVDPILAAINDTVNNPSVISVSWSYPELYSSVADVQVSNQVYAQAVALGITVCCSTGDFGAFSDKQTLSVNRPASSPYVLAVGGTSLILNDNNTIYSENAWPGSGGGYSSFETTPRWQQNLNLPSRGIPDVSANGDSHTGYS
jgi:kumamolisin